MKEYSFDDLNKELSKVSAYGNTLDKSEVSSVDHYISTGNYALNAALTGSVWGGFPNNRSVAIAGPTGTGKTYLILNSIREAQKIGYSIVYYDSENAVDRSLVEKFGIDPVKLRYEPCNTVQEFRSSVTNLTKSLIDAKKKGLELPRIMVVLDSAGNLATQKEIDDAASGSDKSDMTRAKILKSTFRILMTQLGICRIPFLFTNHVYQTQDLFSKTIAGGGCLDPDSLIIMSDGSFKKIKDVKSGDFVKTLIGEKEVLQTWDFEKESYEVEFEDGTKIICSEDHRFYIGDHDDWAIEEGWISIKDLKEGEYIKQMVGLQFKQLKVKSLKSLGSTKVKDLTIEEAQHYISANGAINHNTGPEYAASIILFLNKAKLADGNSTGIIVTAKPNKNRFAKPTPVKFWIDFNKGMNPYVGLQEFISWDNCGIQRGRFITEKDYSKISEKDQSLCRKHVYTNEKNTETTVYFQPSDTARKLCVKHLNDTIDLNMLFRPEIITKEILDLLDENIIKKTFSYGTDLELDEVLDSFVNEDINITQDDE